jgi:hypothetical protein
MNELPNPEQPTTMDLYFQGKLPQMTGKVSIKCKKYLVVAVARHIRMSALSS